MKKIVVSLMVCTTILFSCQKNKEVNISGEVKNAKNLDILIGDSKVSFVPDTFKIADGKFSFKLNVEQAGFRNLIYEKSRKELFVAPGYELKISFDGINLDSSIKIEGKGAAENMVHDSIVKQFKNLDYRYIYTQSPDLSSKYIDSAVNYVQNYFEKLIKVQKLDKIYIEVEKNSIMYQSAYLKTLVGLQKNIKDSTFYKFTKEIQIENEACLGISNYQIFIDYYLNYLNETASILKSDSIGQDAYLNRILTIIKGFKSDKIKEYLVFRNLKSQLEYAGVKDFDKYLEYFKKQNTDEVYAKEMEKTYAKKQLLAPGKKAPEFTCIDKDSLAHSLKDFKGKYVYIDFWATWCGPCRQELPHYLKLQGDYKGKNIVFVSISVDEDKNSWLKVVNENKSEGVSLLAENGWRSAVARSYQIAGIPTFVLIDREGNIINSQAPRPSSLEIRTTLDQLLVSK